MFEITFADHLRLTFDHIVAAHQAHADIARAHARRSRWLKGGESLLMAAVVVTTVGAASGWGRLGIVAAAVLAGLALVVLIVDLVLDLDRSAQAHFQSAVRFWSMRERYRALLADLHDGAISQDAARAQRNALVQELRQVHETTPLDGVDIPVEGNEPPLPTDPSALVAATGK